MRTFSVLALVTAAAATALVPVSPLMSPAHADDAPKPAADVSAEVLGFTVNRIDGTPQNLADFKGKVLIIVNVASQCGYTPQYAGLQRLYDEKKDAGLEVLAFPANNFGNQEPGTNQEIASFCSSKFGVTFPMFEKIDVTGPQQHPLYKRLASQPAPIGGDPKWNFTKFVVDREGRVVARYDSKTKPDDPAFLARLNELLAK